MLTKKNRYPLRDPGTNRTDQASLILEHDDFITNFRTFIAIQLLTKGSY
ncbi:MAG: hypothetical protein ISS29_08595 [Candidatus Marinimicrobia bacterium]|nr:hypothetical protein [Candidatus Neomarinimicrobiota bacterium]